LPGFGSLASTNATISSTDHSLSVIRAAIAAASFDHLVGALLKKPRYVEAECLGSLEVDEELEFGR
jgi:uncharacterized membrane protein